MYAVMVEDLSGKVDYIVTYIIVVCNAETSTAASECVTHIKGLQATVEFYLNIRGVNVITCT